MNDPDPQSNPHQSDPDRREDVADQNVERLISKAYRPESPSPDFAQRVTKRMLAEASGRAAATPRRRQTALWSVARWAVAAVVLIAIGAALGRLLTTTAWQPFAGTTPPSRPVVGGDQPVSPMSGQAANHASRTARHWPIEHALTPRP